MLYTSVQHFINALRPESSYRRLHQRAACNVPVTITFITDEHTETLTATAVDISKGGLLIKNIQLPEGIRHFNISFTIPDELLTPEYKENPHIKTVCHIRYADYNEQVVGVAFDQPIEWEPTQVSRKHLFWLGIFAIFALAGGALISYRPSLFKYALVAGSGFLVTSSLVPLVLMLTIKLKMIDRPGSRHRHTMPTPRGGGVAVVLGFYAACAAAFFLPWGEIAGTLTTKWMYSFLIGSFILLLVGIIDDIRGVKPLLKLGGQVLASLIMIASGFRLGSILMFDLPIWIDYALTLIWFIAIINAFNLIDGLDGLATGLTLIAATGLAFSFILRRMPNDALILMGLIGACLAFLRYNYHPATIFLGDSGSMFLGFTLASISLTTGGKSTLLASIGIPLLAVGVPVFDTMLAIWRRSIRMLFAKNFPGTKKPEGIMDADAEHLHHRFMEYGMKQHQVAIILYVVNALLVLVGILSLIFKAQSIGIFLIAFVAGVYVVVRHLAHVELWDTGWAIMNGLRRPPGKVTASLLYPVWDLSCLAISLYVSVRLACSYSIDHSFTDQWLHQIPFWISPIFVCLCFAHTYKRVWSRARFGDYLSLSSGLTAGILISLGITVLITRSFTRNMAAQTIIYIAFSHSLILGSRFFLSGLQDILSLSAHHERFHRHRDVKRILLYGAGVRCLLYLREQANLKDLNLAIQNVIIGIIDDEPNLRLRRVYGYDVLGNTFDIPNLVSKHRIDKIIVTARLSSDALNRILTYAGRCNIIVSEWECRERELSTATWTVPNS